MGDYFFGKDYLALDVNSRGKQADSVLDTVQGMIVERELMLKLLIYCVNRLPDSEIYIDNIKEQLYDKLDKKILFSPIGLSLYITVKDIK